MNIEKTFIKDVYVCTPIIHEDERGFFMESYRKDVFEKNDIFENFLQDNHSLSKIKNTVRGLNFQYDPPMAKIMRVTRGVVFLVAVDIRKGSPTFGKWIGVEASEDNKKQLYAPGGFARGFQTLTDNCEVQYKCSSIHNPVAEGQILWNDKDINIDWPIKYDPILSEKNKKAPTLKEWLSSLESDIFSII